MQLRSELRLDLSNHRRVKRAIRTGEGPVRTLLDDWERLYRAFILGRFDRFSVGGGSWPRLRPATARRKRKNRDKILVHTRFMRLKLQTGVKMLRRGRDAVRFGFDMKATHPDAGMATEELATIHDQGLGGVPRRRILVQPDAATLGEMRKAASRRLADGMNGR